MVDAGSDPARLRVRVLGEFRIDGTDLDGLRSRQARVLLKRLALAQGRPVPAESLAEVVWGERRPANPDRDLHVLLSRARSVVGGRIELRDGGYALAADWWDVVELAALTQEARRRVDEGDALGARTAADAALTLVRGPLLADEPEAEWLTADRVATGTLVAEARKIAGETALEVGQVGEAAALAREALAHDPYDESALRLLMRAHVLAGRPASALAEFAEARTRLADELGVDPSAETLALHERVLRGESAERSPAPGAGPRIVGREAELAALDDELDLARRGVRIVAVAGEAGIGKSALLAAWGHAAAERGTVVLAAGAVPDGLALQPVLDALMTRAVEQAEDAATGAVLPGPTVSPEALARLMFDRVDVAIGSIDTSAGIALVLDEADHADKATWDWITHLRTRPAEHPLLVVVAGRDPAGLLVDPDRRLTLSPLDRDGVEELVGTERAEELWQRGGGNPLLTVELARADPGVALPDPIRELTARRLRRTGDAASTLQAAAVLGATVDLDLLAGVLDLPPVTVLDHLDVGLRQTFLVEQRGGLAFAHDLVRAAVAADAGAARRAWLHREAARLLRERPGASPVELARHARAGGDPVLAADGLAAAAEVARTRLDLGGAEALLDEAIELHDTAAHRIARSRIKMARGNVDGADEDARVAMADDPTGEALELRAWAARNRHDLDAAVRLGTAAAARTVDPGIRASSLIAVAFGHRGTGDLRAADRVLAEAAVGAPPDLGLPAWTGVLRVHQGRPREALEQLEPQLGADVQRGLQGYWVEHTLQMTAHAYGLLGRVDDALRVVDLLETALERRGTAVRYAGVQHTYRSWLLRNLGDPSAEDLARAGLELAGSAEIAAQCHLDVADSLLRVGRLADAETELVRAREGSGARWFHNKWRFDQRLGLIQARLHLADQDPSAAAAAAEPVALAAGERGDERYSVLARLVLATAAGRRGTTYDGDSLARDLDALADVAAVEGWWLAADVAEATGSEHARAVANAVAAQVSAAAGQRADSFRAVAGRRLS